MDTVETPTVETVRMADEMLSQMKVSSRLQETNNMVNDLDVGRCARTARLYSQPILTLTSICEEK